MSFFDDLDSSLDAQSELDNAEADAETWKAKEPGDTLKGMFLKAQYRVFPDRTALMVLVRDTETGEALKFWASSWMIRQRIEDQKPKPGKGIAIRYDGEGEKKDPARNPSKRWTVVSEASDTEYWKGLSVTDGPVQASTEEPEGGFF